MSGDAKGLDGSGAKRHMGGRQKENLMSKYPHIQVAGDHATENLFGLVAQCAVAAERGRVPAKDINGYLADVRSSDSYQDVLETSRRWFQVR